MEKFRKIQKSRLTWALIQIEKHDKLTPLHHIGKKQRKKQQKNRLVFKSEFSTVHSF